MAFFPLPPGCRDNIERFELDPLPDQWTNDRLALYGIPQRLGRMVVHELVRAVEETACSEFVMYAFVNGVVENHCSAERTVDAIHRDATDGVLEHFMPR